MESEINPYEAPKSTIRSTEEIALKRAPVLLIFFFALITGGIYVPFWYWRRRDVLNRMAPERGVTTLSLVAFTILVVVFVASFTMAFMTEGAELTPNQELPLQILNWSYAIVVLVLGFRVKGILEANYADRISGVGVFFLNIFYLQYKINRLGTGEPQTASLGLT
jgi:hypothetical protein